MQQENNNQRGYRRMHAGDDRQILGAALQKRRKETGLSRDKLADLVGTHRQTIAKLERGERSLDREWAVKFAPHLHCSPQEILFPPELSGMLYVPTIPVKGEAAAGVWMESYDADERTYPPIPASPDPRFSGVDQFAVKVIGDSMDRILPDGAFAICVEFWHARNEPAHGDVVFVRRVQAGSAETTIKQVRLNDGAVELWPASNNPKHASPIIYTDGVEDSQVQILGLVIGRYEVF